MKKYVKEEKKEIIRDKQGSREREIEKNNENGKQDNEGNIGKNNTVYSTIQRKIYVKREKKNSARDKYGSRNREKWEETQKMGNKGDSTGMV